MVEQQDTNLGRTYAALSDPTRREILFRLMGHEARVTELAAPFDMSFNAVSKHVRVLERAGLVRREVRGREHYLTLDATPLMEASEWIDAYRTFWEKPLGHLESFPRNKKTRKNERTV